MKSTTRFKQNIRGLECLNCKQPISGNDNFCSNCGQVNDEQPISIKQFVSEFFSGFFSFDTRFFNTFVPLLFKPGKVSKDYVGGRRKRYVNPFQLYLNITIIFFLLQGLFSTLDEYKTSGSFSKKETAKATDSILKATDSILKVNNIDIHQVQENFTSATINTPFFITNDTIGNLEADSIYRNISSGEKTEIGSIVDHTYKKTKHYIDSIFENTNILDQLKNQTLTITQKDSIFDKFYGSYIDKATLRLENDSIGSWNLIQNISKLKDLSAHYVEDVFEAKKIDYDIPKKHKTSIEDSIIKGFVGESAFKRISDFMAYDKKNENISTLQALENLGYKKTRRNIFYYKKAQDFNKFKNDSNFRKTYLDRVISKISIALFFMLPIFTWFISLLYIRGKKNYTEHLVFVFNVQTVFFILLIFFTIFDRVLKTDVGIAIFLLVFLFYLYKSLRNFYKQKRFKTIVKFLLLNFVFIILSSIGGLFISFLSLAL